MDDTPTTKTSNFEKRISAFIDVESSLEKKDTTNLLFRHKERLKRNKKLVTNKTELFIPINDQRISFSLTQVMFSHPFLLIGLINDPNLQPIPENKINEILLPFHLFTDSSPSLLIPQLAKLFTMNTTEFLIYFKGKQTKTKIIKDNWANLYSRSNIQKSEIESQLKVFFDHLVAHFPDEDWELRSLDDLYSLHVLACSMNMRFFLIFPRIPEKSVSTYSLSIGIENNNKYEIYIVILGPNKFLIAQPLNYKKVIYTKSIPPETEQNEKHANFLNTFETIDQNFAVYYNYNTKLFTGHNDSRYKRIEGHISEKTAISSPKLRVHPSSKDHKITINIEIPTFDKDNTALLTSFIESITDKCTPLKKVEDENDENDSSSKTFTISCKNAYKVMGSDKFYIVSKETKRKKQKETLNDISLVHKPQYLDAPCKEVIKNQMIYMGNQDIGDMPDNDALRIVIASLPRDQNDTEEKPQQLDEEVTLFDQSRVSFQNLIKSKQPPSLTPLFLPQKSRITLAQCANTKYAQDLCTLSILKYCAGHVNIGRKCCKCQCLCDQSMFMLPYQISSLAEILFICRDCISSKGTQLLEMNQHDTLLYGIARKMQSGKKKSSAFYIKEIDNFIQVYERNIQYMREHPIGPLRQMHKLIDIAFATLQKIISSHKTMSATGPVISLHSMLGIRDINEAEIQLQNYTINEQYEPVSSSLFVEYLNKQTDIQYTSQQYELVKKPEEIIKDLDQNIVSIFDEMTFKKVDECPVKMIDGKPQKILPLYNVRSFQDPINHLMEVKFNFPGKENEKRSIIKYKYKTHVIRSASHLCLSPESTITTSKEIIYLWKYNKNTMILLAQEELLEQNDDNDYMINNDSQFYRDVYLYLVPLGNTNLEFCVPLMTFKGVAIKCADFVQNSSTHQLAIFYHTVEIQQLLLIDVHPKRKLCQIHKAEIRNICKMKYGREESTLFAAVKDEFDKIVFYAINTSYKTATKHHLSKNEDFELVGTPQYLLAVKQDGTVEEITEAEEEEENGENEEENENEGENENKDENQNEEENQNENEEDNNEEVPPFSKLQGVSVDYPLISTMLGSEQGIANIVEKYDEDRHFKGEYDIHFFPTQTINPKFNISFGHLNDHQPFFNQIGMFQTPPKQRTDQDEEDENDDDDETSINDGIKRDIWNIHLTAAEYFPALIAYESHGLMFLIRKNMEQFREVNSSHFFAASIRSFYSRTFTKISLHHIEDVIRTHKLKVNIVTFLGDMSNPQLPQFIDTIFGTRFNSVNINGVWVGIRVIRKTAHVILYFHGNNTDKMNELRMTAAVRASNLVMICSYHMINSLNFMKQYQKDVPKRLSLADGSPKLIIMHFQESVNYSLNLDSLRDYRKIKGIKINFCFVPYRTSWNTSDIDDLKEVCGSGFDNDDEEEDDDNECEDSNEDQNTMITKAFIDTIDEFIHSKNAANDKFRKLLDSEDGINMVSQIIATYLTLYEFRDLPIQTVLSYCELNDPSKRKNKGA